MSAQLSDYLWVPRAFVKPHHLNAYRYKLQDPFTKEHYAIDTCDEALEHYRFPRGNLGKIRKVFGDMPIIDQRRCQPLRHKLKFTGELYPEQKRLVHEWLRYGYGIIQAPPRSGKTVMMTALMCRLRQRALMFAHLEDLCHQLEETIRKFTNVGELEDECGEKLIGVLDEWDDFFPIATLSTYQCFAVSPKGRSVLQQHRDSFGLVLVDEVHRGSTELYREVIQKTSAAYRCGVTATPQRKDGLHCVVSDAIGPVVSIGSTEQLTVHYSWEYTDYVVKPFSNWSVMWNRMVKSASRTKQIAKKVIEDVRAGHYVLVTTERLAHLDELQQAINCIDPDISVGVLSGKTRDREGFRLAARKGEYQVVVAMNKIVELGYNIPRWSCFHNTLPMANRENWYQRISRIRTPFEPEPGDTWQKPTPVARIWVDHGHPAIFAYQNIVRKENERLQFTCLNPPTPAPKGRRKGLTGYEAKNE
jgi:superfamily II DNA or RNA helicase